MCKHFCVYLFHFCENKGTVSMTIFFVDAMAENNQQRHSFVTMRRYVACSAAAHLVVLGVGLQQAVLLDGHRGR